MTNINLMRVLAEGGAAIRESFRSTEDKLLHRSMLGLFSFDVKDSLWMAPLCQNK